MSGLELDLSSAHDLVRDAARRGEPAVFGPAGRAVEAMDRAGHGQLLGGAGPDGDGPWTEAELPAYDDDEAWAGRTVDGAWLAELLTGGDPVHGRGLAIHGARILGGLDLENVELGHRLQLLGCQLGEHRIVLRDARTRTVDLTGIACGGIDATYAHIAGALRLVGTSVRGEVYLVESRVDASVRCDGARIHPPGRTALDAARLETAGSVNLQGGLATGEVRLSGATIRGNLNATGAQLHGPARGAPPGAGPEGVGPPGPGSSRWAVAWWTAGHMALRAVGLQVAGAVFLNDGFVAEGQVQMFNLRVGGDVLCAGGRFENPGGDALSLDGTHVNGGMFLEQAVVRGRVRLVNGDLGGDLRCGGARVEHPEGTALYGSRVKVGGNVFLDQGFVAVGEVRLAGATIGGSIRCTAASLRSLDVSAEAGGAEAEPRPAVALNLETAQIGGDVRLDRGCTATGGVRFAGATVGGKIDCSGGSISAGAADAAIQGTNAHVTGSVDLLGAEIVGGLLVRGISIGGALECAGAHLVARDGGSALSADRSQITGGVLLNGRSGEEGFRAEGAVRIRSATIGGHASCRGGSFSHPGGRALNLSGSRFAGDLLLSGGCTVDGETRLQGATIGNDLDCSGGSFSDPGGVALRLVGAQVAGIVHLDEGFSARGEVRMSNATVGGYVSCRAGRFVNPGGDALRAVGTRVAGTLTLAEGFHAEGAVVLRDASVGTLRDDAASWPSTVDLDGFRYERLVCPRPDRGWRVRRGWLRRQLTPSAQGYVGLAAVYRAAGDELDARRILIERHNALLRPPGHWRAQLPSGPTEPVRRLWRWVLRITIGHGFAPGRSLLIALPLVLALALWVDHARADDMLVPTDETAVTSARGARGEPRSSRCDDRYPCLQPLIYAVDTMIPIVELGQRSRWTPDQSHRGATWLDDGRWLAAATWATSALGWVLATLVAASFTQIVRRE